LARGGWVVAEPHIHLERWQTGHATNQAGWSHPGYDRLLAAALAAPTTAERYARYREMEAILAQEMPFIPVYFHTLPRLVSPKVIGYRTTLEDAFPWSAVDLRP
jgi:ABC-type oligopeptide transport system substrate-binding subunit